MRKGWVRGSLAALAGPLLLALAGCSMLPAAAPTVSQMEKESASNESDILLFKADSAVLGVLAKVREAGMSGMIRRDGYRPDAQIHSGDVIAIDVFETGGPNLFGAPQGAYATTSNGNIPSAPARASTIPPQLVEANGVVKVPFVGAVSVAGLSPFQAAQRIEKLLSDKALQPQVVVTVVSTNTHLANVGGDVNKTGPVPLTLRGERLLDVINEAGGSRDNEFDTDIRLIRGRAEGLVSMTALVASPAQNNILVQPSDQVVVERNPKTFTVMGEAQRGAQYPLDQPTLTLDEALARAGGAMEQFGDLSGVYVFRFEPAEIARALLRSEPAALDPDSPAKIAPEAITGPRPVMYRFDLTSADGYFRAKAMRIRNKDLILISGSQGAQLLKLLTLIRGATGAVNDIGMVTQRYTLISAGKP
jgi:polysaccharide biosynthesis/export protein